jgi:hypothetical protein
MGQAQWWLTRNIALASSPLFSSPPVPRLSRPSFLCLPVLCRLGCGETDGTERPQQQQQQQQHTPIPLTTSAANMRATHMILAAMLLMAACMTPVAAQDTKGTQSQTHTHRAEARELGTEQEGDDRRSRGDAMMADIIGGARWDSGC